MRRGRCRMSCAPTARPIVRAVVERLRRSGTARMDSEFPASEAAAERFVLPWNSVRAVPLRITRVRALTCEGPHIGRQFRPEPNRASHRFAARLRTRFARQEVCELWKG